MYYGDDVEDSCDGSGCDSGSQVNDIDVMVTVSAPGIASREILLGYDEGNGYGCWAWWYDFSPNYGAGNPIYVLNCFDDGDCSAVQYCDKSSSWSNWDCASKFADGVACGSDSVCLSGFCDIDGVGLGDDGHCFSVYNSYFDGEENTKCEYSTGVGNSNCDERGVGDDLNLCSGIAFYEEECSSSCDYVDVVSVFECGEAGCGCSESLCDGLTNGTNIVTCSGEMSYFADECGTAAQGLDREDNVCRSLVYTSGCSADSECNGVVAGTGNCTETCIFDKPSTPTILLCDGVNCTNNETFVNEIDINCSGSLDLQNDNITYFIDAYHISPDVINVNSFNNSLESEDLIFNGSGNITRYLKINKNANVTSGFLNLSNGESANYADDYSTTKYQTDAYEYNSLGFSSGQDMIFRFDLMPLSVGNITYKFESIAGFHNNASAYIVTYMSTPDSGGNTSIWYSLDNSTWIILNSSTSPEITIGGIIPVNNLNEFYVRIISDTHNLANENPVVSLEVNYTIYNPTNLYLEIGDPDGIYEWNYTGESNETFFPTQTSDLSLGINNALNNGACDCSGCILDGDNCTIPFLFHSDDSVRLNYENIDVDYQMVGYFWKLIGNHSESSILNWDVSNMVEQSEVDLRCRAIDLNGSNIYSDYYNPSINVTTETRRLLVL